MVAAKLDQSRVLVTKFRQNRLTLKGRSAGQRHTDRQTNSAENNGPSGLQSGQQMAMANIHFALLMPHAKCKYCYSSHTKVDHSETVNGLARSTKSNLYRTDL